MENDIHEHLVTCTIDMSLPAHDLEQAVNLLVSVVGLTKARSSCKTCSVARDASEEGVIHYCEAWDSVSAFQRHLHSDTFRRVLTAIDMCIEEPQVTIGDLSGRRGIAYLQELRDNNVAGLTDAGNEEKWDSANMKSPETKL